MSRRGSAARAGLTLLAIAACAGGQPEPAGRPGIRFDPSTLRLGDRVGTLVADSVVARVTPVDSSYVGTARFRGEIELAGATFRHPESDSEAVCFEVDSASAVRLPRWRGDERRPWFCFENDAEARRALGPPSAGVRATIVIDRFTIHRGLSDEVNAARLVRVVPPPSSVIGSLAARRSAARVVVMEDGMKFRTVTPMTLLDVTGLSVSELGEHVVRWMREPGSATA